MIVVTVEKLDFGNAVYIIGYGTEWILKQTFPDTEFGAAQANQMALHLQDVVDRDGISGLARDQWKHLKYTIA